MWKNLANHNGTKQITDKSHEEKKMLKSFLSQRQNSSEDENCGWLNKIDQCPI